MNTVHFSDAQIDEQATRYAASQRVSYAAALSAVTARFSEPLAGYATLVMSSPSNHSSDADKALHAKALDHSQANRVSYAEALTAVTASFSEAPAKAAVDDEDSDSRLHFEAMSHHLQHRVPYAQALLLMAEKRQARRTAGAATGREGSGPDADQALHARAVSYAESNLVSYAEALTALADGVAGGVQQALQAQVIEIFKAGTHVDTAGNTRVFTVEDVKGMASAYDPALHEAPLVIGHPMDDKPAQGWVTALKASEEGVLLMMVRKVDPTFAADVKAGRFLKRSASFYPPMAPNNPRPGRWYLRHVAWLGAMPPAVKGLSDVNFGGADAGTCFDF